jgi:hypothetical protein
MNNQLSFFPELDTKDREYVRDRSGRFASKEQLEYEEAKRNAKYYKLMFEAERRKLKPLLKRLVSVERELNELKLKSKQK